MLGISGLFFNCTTDFVPVIKEKNQSFQFKEISFSDLDDNKDLGKEISSVKKELNGKKSKTKDSAVYNYERVMDKAINIENREGTQHT